MNQQVSERPKLAAATAANPFGAASSKPSNAVAEIEQQRAVAEINAAMVAAKRFPRDTLMAMDRILQACTRPTLAEGALYSYSRGGSDVTGPSIRLAEALAQNWGNIAFGIRELDQRNGESSVEAFAWDLETNMRRTMQFQVKHERHTKKGVTKLTDPRDIYEMVANQGARRMRACILATIPGDVTEAAVEQCEGTMTASADTSPDAIKKMLAVFSTFGVSQDQIQARIQCRIEAIRPAQMVMLRKIWVSMRDGMSKPQDWFETAKLIEPERQNVSTRDDVKTAPSQEQPPKSTGDSGAPDNQRQQSGAADDGLNEEDMN